MIPNSDTYDIEGPGAPCNNDNNDNNNDDNNNDNTMNITNIEM